MPGHTIIFCANGAPDCGRPFLNHSVDDTPGAFRISIRYVLCAKCRNEHGPVQAILQRAIHEAVHLSGIGPKRP